LANEEADLNFQFEMLKHLCEYHVRQLIVPSGVKIDFEENHVAAKKRDIIRSMYTDAIENLIKMNPDNPP
jgi:hypothetical protein